MRLAICVPPLLVLWMMASPLPGVAADRNDIPSCRETYFKESFTETAVAREYLIVVDRTTLLDQSLRSDVAARAVRAIMEGDRITIVSFSSLTDSEFTRVEFEGRLDRAATTRELETRVPGNVAAKARKCFPNQLNYARKAVATSLGKLLDEPEVNARKSEILTALKTVSAARFAPPPSAPRTVLLISDMMESSDLTSFYRAKTLRQIDPDQELAGAEKHSLLGTFAGSRVFVAGAAAAPDSSADRALEARRLLRDFWVRWFGKSGAEVIAWGEPALLRDID